MLPKELFKKIRNLYKTEGYPFHIQNRNNFQNVIDCTNILFNLYITNILNNILN